MNFSTSFTILNLENHFVDVFYYIAGFVTVAWSRSIRDWASSLPLIDAPVFKVMAVWLSTIPSKWAPASRVTVPETCHTIFFACAPPERITSKSLPILRSPVTWKIQVSFAPPLIVTFDPTVTELVQLYSPGESVSEPISPAPRFEKSGVIRPAASPYAVNMSSTAVVRFDEVGDTISAAYRNPVTWVDVAYPVESVCEKPVMYVSAAGLIPTSPVMTEFGIVEIAFFANMT